MLVMVRAGCGTTCGAGNFVVLVLVSVLVLLLFGYKTSDEHCLLLPSPAFFCLPFISTYLL
jgi:hypothetical protein